VSSVSINNLKNSVTVTNFDVSTALNHLQYTARGVYLNECNEKSYINLCIAHVFS